MRTLAFTGQKEVRHLGSGSHGAKRVDMGDMLNI
eukprot:CAMPEP_0174257174 /NCGR_PEP_ID=MMETSP0439-20130205/6342_1 /TAXON_ID=0 /ORGANISM="Stereomyxa ramosa, Strain Chinc5" /LENGTH=33 /DNA_ID= /DNA_START= /DNA_END= /DNA_ORIENTATION=